MEDNKEFYREIASLSNVTAADAKEFSEALGIKIVLDYIETGEIEIPFLGKLKIYHEKDKLHEGGVQAVIKTDFIPDSFLLKSIGQHSDGIETEAEKLYISKIRRILKQIIKE